MSTVGITQNPSQSKTQDAHVKSLCKSPKLPMKETLGVWGVGCLSDRAVPTMYKTLSLSPSRQQQEDTCLKIY